MGFFDFFRKKQEEKAEKKIGLDELGALIEDEAEKVKERNREIKSDIEKSLNLLIKELRLDLALLKNVNLDKRKEQERLKMIVRENLYFYNSYLEKLILELEKLDRKISEEEYIARIQASFINFKKNSEKSFEKATILIGKELEKTSGDIRRFFESFNASLKESSGNFERLRKFDYLETMKKELYNSKTIEKKVKERIGALEKERIEFEKEKKEAEERLVNFKKSEDFLSMIRKNREKEERLSKLKHDAFELKERLGLRNLLKIYHSDEKKRKILSRYHESFLASLENDEKLEIFSISEILEFEKEVREIKERLGKVNEAIDNRAENQASFLENKIKEAGFNAESKSREIGEEKRKIEKFGEKRKEVLQSIAESSREIFGVKVEI